MNPKEMQRARQLLQRVDTIEELAEIERIIEEAKGKIKLEPSMGFWEGKTPCWEMFRCPDELRKECPAFNYRSLPCWEIEGTYCKACDREATGNGDGRDVCQYCRVYKRWGHGEPIEIKLYGKGINPGGR